MWSATANRYHELIQRSADTMSGGTACSNTIKEGLAKWVMACGAVLVFVGRRTCSTRCSGSLAGALWGNPCRLASSVVIAFDSRHLVKFVTVAVRTALQALKLLCWLIL